MDKRNRNNYHGEIPEFLHENHKRANLEDNERRKENYFKHPENYYQDDIEDDEYENDVDDLDFFDEDTDEDFDNYDEQEEISKRVRKRSKKSRRKESRKKFFRVVASLCLILVIVGIGVLIGMYNAVKIKIKDLDFRALANAQTTVLYYLDSDGDEHEFEELTNTNSTKWVGNDEICKYLKDATVAIEDKRFYKHKGVDFSRTFTATIKYGLSKLGIGDSNYGGSTITQQTYKNFTSKTEKTSARKINEILSAFAMEKELSKEDILTIYLNIVYYANGCTGVEKAANYYYNKDASELNLQESATIAGITQNPTLYDPINSAEKCKEKRNIVLKSMLEQGFITNEQYEDAKSSDLDLHKASATPVKIESYFVERVIQEVAKDLVDKKEVTEDVAYKKIYNGGLKIYTTIDPRIQSIVDDVYIDHDNFPDDDMQSAAIIIDPYTGRVKAMAGAVGKKTENLPLNRAYSDPHQPGSSIKPLSVYAPAIDQNKITESTVIKDESVTIGSDDWKPHNSYKGFKGNMLPKEAVGRSSNIPAVKVLDEIGLSTSKNYLTNKFHLSTIVDNDINYSSLALGGLTNGANVVDMAAAYSTFPNGGEYIKPHTYIKVLESNGEVYLENKEDGERVISEETAYIMTDLLSAPVNQSYGTATSACLDDMPTYGKTGTTDDNIDKWFVGFTPYLVTAVRCGYDNRSQMNVSGNPSVAVWKRIMEEIHEDYDYKELKVPNNVVSKRICTQSGKIPRSSCDSTIGYFKEGKEPDTYCSYHGGGKDEDKNDNKPTATPKTSASPGPSDTPSPTKDTKPTPSPKDNDTETNQVDESNEQSSDSSSESITTESNNSSTDNSQEDFE